MMYGLDIAVASARADPALPTSFEHAPRVPPQAPPSLRGQRSEVNAARQPDARAKRVPLQVHEPMLAHCIRTCGVLFKSVKLAAATD